MTAFHGRNGTVKVGSPADNIVSEVSEWEIETDRPLADSTAMRDLHQKQNTGIPGYTGSMTCWYDKADAAGQRMIEAAETYEFELYPTGEGAGEPMYSGVASVQSVTRAGAKDDNIGFNVSFKVNGALTIAN